MGKLEQRLACRCGIVHRVDSIIGPPSGYQMFTPVECIGPTPNSSFTDIYPHGVEILFPRLLVLTRR